MQIELFWSDKLKRPDSQLFKAFAQKAVNRLMQGWPRYGFDPKFRYMTRLEAEVKAYRKTGNCEHLVNAANYAYMESEKPEHPRSHWDTSAKSATRKREWFGDDNA
jgi:hypothetical protein